MPHGNVAAVPGWAAQWSDLAPRRTTATTGAIYWPKKGMSAAEDKESSAAKLHAVLARFCSVNSTTRGAASAAIASSSAGAAWPAVANAHAVLERFCGLNSPTRIAASAAIASSSAGAAWPAVANAHTVLESSCGLNSPTRGAASAAI
eukprot:scaffold14454_cov122-Isochrysis_galbana.AAC.3